MGTKGGYNLKKRTPHERGPSKSEGLNRDDILKWKRIFGNEN